MKTTTYVSNLNSVKSSNIVQVGFEKDLNRVFVEFKGGGIYTYEGVKEEDFNSLLKAESIGSYFSKSFKNNYKFNKLENVQLKKKEEVKDGVAATAENGTVLAKEEAKAIDTASKLE